MKGCFVDIDAESGARAEVAKDPEKPGVMVRVTRGFTLDGAGWKRLVDEVDAMVRRESSSR